MPDRAADLLTRYRSFGLEPLPWAYPLPPSIPFVGEDYGRWGGLLVYASAENFSHYEREPDRVPGYLKDNRALNRHRAAFEEGRDGFFPNVHMAPFNDGSLLVAAWYYLWRTHGDPPDDPRDLLESIAAANFCKFSIAGAKNRDYAGDSTRLAVSLPYVQADLTVLQPATVILPRTIWKHQVIREPVTEAAPSARILPLPQFNRRVVNIHLVDHEPRIRAVERSVQVTILPSWVAHLNGYRGGRAYRFLVEMDEVLRAVRTPSSSPPVSPP